VHGAGEYAQLEGHVRRRRGVRDERHGDALGDLTGAPLGRATPDTGPEPRLSAGTHPSAKCRPTRRLAVAARFPPDVHDPGAGAETKQRQGDRCCAEVTAMQHAAWHHHDHGVAATAPVPADGHDAHHRRRPDRARTAHLPQPQAVPDQPERAAYRPPCAVAARASGRPRLVNARQALRPNVDIEERMNDLRRAPLDHSVRSTTGGSFPRRTLPSPFCTAGSVPMLCLRSPPYDISADVAQSSSVMDTAFNLALRPSKSRIEPPSSGIIGPAR
jgi:hypothetical protein